MIENKSIGLPCPSSAEEKPVGDLRNGLWVGWFAQRGNGPG